ncbi:MAG: hypothetical protein HY292_18815 [Planctomycetes bacterium]|nr:hypothetical protein [Planctomycetota bacterium]
MPKTASNELAKLARYFSEEVESRAWGKTEFDKLISESKKSREKIDNREREMTRHILSALDRVTSIQVAADAIVQIVDDSTKPIAARVILDVLAVLQVQAHRATFDAHSALRTIEPHPTRFESRLRRLPFGSAAAALAQVELDSTVLTTPERSRPRTRLERALYDVVRVTGFVENAIGCVERLVGAEAKKRRAIDAAAVKDLAKFIVSSAEFARDTISLRTANAIEATAKRRVR